MYKDLNDLFQTVGSAAYFRQLDQQSDISNSKKKCHFKYPELIMVNVTVFYFSVFAFNTTEKYLCLWRIQEPPVANC